MVCQPLISGTKTTIVLCVETDDEVFNRSGVKISSVGGVVPATQEESVGTTRTSVIMFNLKIVQHLVIKLGDSHLLLLTECVSGNTLILSHVDASVFHECPQAPAQRSLCILVVQGSVRPVGIVRRSNPKPSNSCVHQPTDH